MYTEPKLSNIKSQLLWLPTASKTFFHCTTPADDIFKTNKGELINFCLKNDKRIREIDSAIPLVISKELNEFGLDRSFMVTAYWKNGEIEILNILQHYIFVKNSL